MSKRYLEMERANYINLVEKVDQYVNNLEIYEEMMDSLRRNFNEQKLWKNLIFGNEPIIQIKDFEKYIEETTNYYSMKNLENVTETTNCYSMKNRKTGMSIKVYEVYDKDTETIKPVKLRFEDDKAEDRAKIITIKFISDKMIEVSTTIIRFTADRNNYISKDTYYKDKLVCHQDKNLEQMTEIYYDKEKEVKKVRTAGDDLYYVSTVTMQPNYNTKRSPNNIDTVMSHETSKKEYEKVRRKIKAKLKIN